MTNNLKQLVFSPKGIFISLSLFIGILMLSVSGGYGLIEDSEIHNEHGKMLLEYFQNKNDRAATNPFLENGKPVLDVFVNFSLYGGIFDLTATFLHDELFSSIDVFKLRNYLNSIFGFLCMFFCGLVAKELGNWKAGIAALIFAVLTPLLFGHSMNNPVDIPFATFYIISIYAVLGFVKNLPKISVFQVVFLVFAMSIAINIRSGGIILVCFFLLYVFMHWLSEAKQQLFSKKHIINGFRLGAEALGIALLAYLSACIFWPYAQTNPLLVPYKALVFFSGTPFNAYQLFEGKWVSRTALPWYYGPKWLLITAPLHIIIGAMAVPLIFIPKISNYTRNKRMPLVFVFLLFIIPLLYVALVHANLYDNCRHLLFVLPPIISCAAVAFESIATSIKNKIISIAIYTLAGLLLLQPLVWMVKYHPLQSLYFSPVIGGNKGAFKKYEMDYWGFSVKPAIDWLAKNTENATPEKPARVRLWYGNQLKASYYLEKHANLKYVRLHALSPDWDYSIVMPAEAKYNKALLRNWPPGNTVHQIMAGKAPVCAIISNDIHKAANDPSVIEQNIAANPSANGYIYLSVIYYNKRDYINCILSCRKALKLNPASAIGYNNICSSYNSMQMFDEAQKAGKKAVELAPANELAKSNLKVAINGLQANTKKPRSVNEYLNSSYNYYMLGHYDGCIKQSMEALKIDPNNASAYNNIGSAYNALGKYQEAINACEKAVALNPDFDLAKNNLNMAKKRFSDNK